LINKIENELSHPVIFVTPVKLKEVRKWNIVVYATIFLVTNWYVLEVMENHIMPNQ